MTEKISILGFQFTNSTYGDITEKVAKQISQKNRYLIHNVNVYILLEALKKESFQRLLKSFSNLYSDGIGLYFASKLLYGKNGFKQKITGTDLYPYLFRLANRNCYKIFFWGGSKLANSRLVNVMRTNYPKINLVGNYERDFLDFEHIKNQINALSPDMLFIGLGTPTQEEISKKLYDTCNTKLIICVGSGLDYTSGVYKRAPLFFQKIGFEWFVRLIYNPKRYWKRYIFGIPEFIFRVIKERFNKHD